MRRAILVLGLVVFLSPAGLSLAGRSDEIEAELSSLRTQLQLLEKREEDYRKEVQEITKTLDRVSQQAAQGQADQQLILNQVRARLELLEQNLQAASQQQQEIISRLTTLEGTFSAELIGIKARLDRLDGGEVKPGAAIVTPPAPLGAKDYKQAYNLAVEQYRLGNYDAARAQFEAFLKAYPKTDLSDNAQFGIGECHFALAQFDKAVLEYDKVRKNFPTGNKVPNAVWKMALGFEQLGNRDVAKGFLKELMDKYPKSPEADLARKKLATWQ